ncbi:alpha/beta hydrolase [Clostridium estertheticum]|uniref:alpha/beta hydrolase n=1 Tax=Clostridium estertheticum TaxID=238834 RepID=UPI001C0E0680|nr:alpha/beta hydrolase [Clostridium estertheticum]MBU3214461.1 alpha/beta hydrolase [Clostridium estertheticum]WAG56446.1 alpha/beta hydrolase [Clostridium estertheticum]
MINKTIDLWGKFPYENKGNDDFRPSLDTYLLKGDKLRGAVLICPGGAYAYTSLREAEPIAIKFNAAGFHAFVLYYSVAPNKYPQALLDLSRAMCILRENSKEWKIDVNKIAVCGFSAGGHVAASLGVYWDELYLKGVPGIEVGKNNPNAQILCYPVITSGVFTHENSLCNLIGDNASESLKEKMSLEHNVSEKTPPTFLWHTFEDNSVPVENTLLFAKALRNKKIPFELHIYPEGPHGLSLANEETREEGKGVYPNVATWMDLCITWLTNLFSKK